MRKDEIEKQRTNILNYLARTHGSVDYLEIGVGNRRNFRSVVVKNKEGVDPVGNCKYPMTSDQFFEFISEEKTWDLIFIDGYREAKQVERDIENSLKHLNKGGLIVVHDTRPMLEEVTVVPRQTTMWLGDVWKTIVKLRCTRPDLDITTVRTPYGCTIIQPGKQKVYDKAPLEKCLTWKYFDEHRKELLNIIDPDTFYDKFDVMWQLLIKNDAMYKVERKDKLGWNIKENPPKIPQEVLDSNFAVIMRYAFGIGDWGVITAMPRLLKKKYPDIRVLIPNKSFMMGLMSDDEREKWDIWDDPVQNAFLVFKNNPHLDGVAITIPEFVYHDHYRIYDPDKENEPLVEQMLRFWGLEDDEIKDSQPELYFNKKEKASGDKIIKDYDEYGCLLISHRYEYKEEDNKKIIEILKNNDIPYFYYTYKPIEETPFNFIKKAGNLESLPVRVQLYIKCNAKLNVGNQSGMNDLVVRYSDVYVVPRALGANYIRGQHYL